jgi:hypothetical protein
MRNLGTEVLASVIVVVVLSEEVPSPEEVVEFARRENAVFKRANNRGDSEYVMLKRAHEAEAAKWGVRTLLSRNGRHMWVNRTG